MDMIISSRYATALFELAVEKACVDDYQQQAELLLNAIESDEEYLKILEHPQITGAEKLDMLKGAFGSYVSEDVLGLISVVMRKNREAELCSILRAFIDKVREYKHITTATVESAVQLDSDRLELIRQKLNKILNKQVEIKALVVPELIGGLRISVDGHVIDNTVKMHIDLLKKQLTDMKLA